MRYQASGGYTNREGLVRSTDFNRQTLNLRLHNDKGLENLSIDFRLNLTRNTGDRVITGSGNPRQAGPIFQAFRANPAVPPTITPGKLSTNPLTGDRFRNPIAEAVDREDDSEKGRYLGQVKGVYSITNDLSFVAKGGAVRQQKERKLFFPLSTNRGFQLNTLGMRNKVDVGHYSTEGYFNYNGSFADVHELEATAGGSWEKTTIDRLSASVTDFTTEKLGFNSLESATNWYGTSSDREERRLLSSYLRLNYRYDNRYLLTFTGRADGSSRFAKNDKWGIFSSGAVAWRISEESFMDDVDAVSNLKLRASLGVTGSQAIPAYGSLARVAPADYLAGDTPVGGVAPSTLGNVNLTWESTTQFDVGLDLSLFQDRLGLTADYYNKRTDDLLQSLPVPRSSGFATSIQNVGSIRNRGYEAQLRGDILTGDFGWRSTVNFSRNQSEVLDLGESEEIFPPFIATKFTDVPSNIIKEGEPYGTLYGYKVDGLLQKEDFSESGQAEVPVISNKVGPGEWNFVDVNEDGNITPDDRTIIGDPQPDFQLGWANDFSYSRFTLNFLINSVVGQDIMNYNKLYFGSGILGNNAFRDYYRNRWTSEDPHNDARYPIYGQEPPTHKPNSVLVEDGSYVRLKNATLAYQVPEGLTNLFRGARVYVKGTNLITLTDYTGFDPEVSSFGDQNLMPGLDFGSYPRARTYTLGVKLEF